MQTKIWLSPPHLSGLEQKFVQDGFNSNWVTTIGPNIDAFESDIAKYLKEDVLVTVVNSGTAAIHLALQLLGVSKNHMVICQSKTFIASANPIKYLQANPIFIDSEPDTYNMCPKLLEKAITESIAKNQKPKAIITVSIYGMPYKITEIHAIAKKYNIPIIEDNAEALGSSYHNQKCGTFGDISILSFNGNKIITTSGGGAIITKNKKQKEQANYLATQAKEVGSDYSHKSIGYNYRMSNILAGIGRAQIAVLEERIEARRFNFEYYKSNLKQFPIQFIEEPRHVISNRWLTCVIFKTNTEREAIRKLLAKNNIESRISWKPLHLQPIFKNELSYQNGNSENLYKKGLCLPSGSNLTQDNLHCIVKIIQDYYQ